MYGEHSASSKHYRVSYPAFIFSFFFFQIAKFGSATVLSLASVFASLAAQKKTRQHSNPKQIAFLRFGDDRLSHCDQTERTVPWLYSVLLGLEHMITVSVKDGLTAQPPQPAYANLLTEVIQF